MFYQKFCLLLTLLLSLGSFRSGHAATWELLGLEHESIETIVTDPYNDAIVYAGAFNTFMDPDGIGGIFKSVDGGATWDTLLTGGISVSELVIHPTDANILYAALGGANASMPGAIKTIDGGMTWFWAGNGITVDWETDVQVLTMDPRHPDTLYAGTGGAFGGTLYRSVNGGISWDNIGAQITDWNVGAIAVAPTDTRTVYVGGFGGGLMFKSTDGGENWQQLPIRGVDGFYCLTISPENSDVLYAGVHKLDSLLQSADGGVIWQGFTLGQAPTRAIVLHPRDSDHIYATSLGVFHSPDGGLSWTALGLTELGGYTLALNASATRLYDGTRRGIYRLELDPLAVEPPASAGQRLWLASNYPNPVLNRTTIAYRLAQATPVSLDIFNVAGQLVQTLVQAEFQAAGEYTIIWDGHNQTGQQVGSGLYFYRLRAGERIETRRLTLMR